MPNFKEDDYQFKGEICNSGYKYYKPFEEDETTLSALLIETKLSDHLRAKVDQGAENLSIHERHVIFDN